MFAHPAAEYFSVGKIGEDQLEDYARRRGKSTEEMRKFLLPICNNFRLLVIFLLFARLTNQKSNPFNS